MNDANMTVYKNVITTSYIGIGAFFAASGIEQTAVIIYAVLILLDVITGMRGAYVLGEEITSKRGMGGLVSKLIMLAIPLSIALMGHGIGMDLKWLVSMSLGILIVYEGYSVLGNLYTIKTKEKIPEFDAISKFLKFAMDFIKTIAEQKIENPQDPKNPTS